MAHGPCPYERTWKELKCACNTVVICSRGGSEWPQEITAVCPFTESDSRNRRAPVYLVCAERDGVLCRDAWGDGEIVCVSVPRNVRELDGRLQLHGNLRRVIFHPSSSLERIGAREFVQVIGGTLRDYFPCGLVEINIPDSVRELCEDCFRECSCLRRVTFGPASSLGRLGNYCLAGTGVTEISVPDSVRELCDGCFKECRSLRRVTFGSSSSLEWIGVSCFEDSGVEEVSIPDSFRKLGSRCFKECRSLRHVIFGLFFVT